MASARALLALLLLVLALHLGHWSPVVSGETQLLRSSPSLAATAGYTLNCASACAVRCSRSWKPKMCKRMCAVCCARCNCVPSGTGVETRAQCPCYANMRNPKGKPKCP